MKWALYGRGDFKVLLKTPQTTEWWEKWLKDFNSVHAFYTLYDNFEDLTSKQINECEHFSKI